MLLNKSTFLMRQLFTFITQKNNNWATGTTPKPTSLTYFGATAINDVIYTVGGFTFSFSDFIGSFEPSAVNEQYMPAGYGTPDPTYQTPAPAPTPTPSLAQTPTSSPTPSSAAPPTTAPPKPSSTATQPIPSPSIATTKGDSGLQENLLLVGAIAAAVVGVVTATVLLKQRRVHS